MHHALKLLTVGGCLLLSTAPAFAETVTLRTANNSIQLSGELLSFDGTTYKLKTSVGELSLDANGLICEGDGCPVDAPAPDFAVSGAQGVADVIFPAVLSAYAAANGSELDTSGSDGALQYEMDFGDAPAKVDVAASSSAQAYDDLIAGRTALALVNRPANADELARVGAAGGIALREHTLAVGGVSVVTSKDNALPSISIENVSRIFAGEITNWSQIGGADAAITLYAREAGSGIAEAFQELVLDPDGRSMAGGVTMAASDEALATAVAADPFGIGFTRFTTTNAARQTPIIGECGLVVTPSEFNIRAEEYPLSYRLLAVTTDQPQSGLLDAVLGFAAEDTAQQAMAAAGMTSQILTSSPVDQQGMRFASALQSGKVVEAIPRLQKMVSEMVVSERLSATFRFEAGSRTLDERGRSDVARVVQLLNAETATGARKSVRIMGFTDSLGNPELNQELSERRAGQVLDALLAQDPSLSEKVIFSPMGFGDISPIGCDQSTKGRWINRRVEVWVSAAAE